MGTRHGAGKAMSQRTVAFCQEPPAEVFAAQLTGLSINRSIFISSIWLPLHIGAMRGVALLLFQQQTQRKDGGRTS
jgi:hypothetical protein